MKLLVAGGAVVFLFILNRKGVLSLAPYLLIGVVMFFTIWKIITGLVGGEDKREAIMAFISGPYAINFWGFEVMLGMVLPFAMLLLSKWKNMPIMVWASVFMFFMRYDLVILGQVVPVLHEIGVNEYPGLLSYTPSVHEIMVTLGAFGMTGLAFLLGERVFAGHHSEDH